MIVVGDDGNKGIEEQGYTISSLGFIVDRYALSFNNEEKQRLYRTANLYRILACNFLLLYGRNGLGKWSDYRIFNGNYVLFCRERWIYDK